MAQLQVVLGTNLLRRQVADLARLTALLPKRRAHRFYRKALRLLDGLRIEEVSGRAALSACGATDLRVQVRVLGMDELISAALRATTCGSGEFDVPHGGSHAM